MSYLNNAVNGAEGAFVDRAIAQLKQADVDVAEWDRANRQLDQRLLTREDQLRNFKEDSVSAAQSIAVLVGDNERVRGELEFLRKQNTRLMNDHVRAQDELAKMRSDLDLCSRAHGRLTDALATAQVEIDKMRLASNVPEDLQNKITTAQTDIGSVLRKLAAAADVLRFANQKLDEAKAPKK